MNFSYLMPVKVIMGKNCIKNNADVFNAGWKKALIVTGRKSAKINGAEKDVCDALSACGVAWEIFDRVEPNPSIANVRKGAEAAKEAEADFIIGIGGGSPMDAAKAIAFLSANDVDDENMFSASFDVKPLPVIAVPTTAGTGSEVTQYSIITVPAENTKKNLGDISLFPIFAFLDASYMEKLPYDVTVNTAVDALSHSMESYLSKRNTTMSSFIALESMAVLGECLHQLRNGDNPSFEIREKLLYASMLGGIAISQTGTTAVHAMGYSLTCLSGIDHGKANGLLMCEFLKFVTAENTEKVKNIFKALGIEDIQAFEALFVQLLGTFKELSEAELKQFTELAVSAKSIANTVPEPTYDEVYGLLKRSIGKLGVK